MKKQTLSLTVEEIAALIKITDPEAQEQVMQSLIENSQNPKTDIDNSDFTDAHPMARRIAEKFRRKAKAAERRRLKPLKTRQSESSATNRQTEDRPTIQIRKDDTIVLELNEATVGRLLWLKQNHKSWAKAINCIVEAISGSEMPRQIRSRLLDLLDYLFTYLNPLMAQASAYHQTPKQFRPRFATA